MNQPFISTGLSPSNDTPNACRGADITLVIALICIPNLGLVTQAAGGFKLGSLPLPLYVVWLAINLIALGVLITLRQLLLLPLNRITQHLQQLRSNFSQEAGVVTVSPLNIPRMAMDIGRFVSFAIEHYRKYLEAMEELACARAMIAQFASEQQMILDSTSREISLQYRAVLTYANYLDEQIASNKLDPLLRYDFDDVCESSFNLKLIAGALAILHAKESPVLDNVALAPLMQQTMLTLAPSLDRRCMKLTTADVDLSVAARGDSGMLAHVLWMMLLGMIRYAADESTLRMRCLHNRDGSKALLSIVVSELSPCRLSENEREDHLLRQLEHLTPHMFAQTIRIHGNIQLADLLIKRIGGEISIVPLTISSCEVCLTLPSAEFKPSSSKN